MLHHKVRLVLISIFWSVCTFVSAQTRIEKKRTWNIQYNALYCNGTNPDPKEIRLSYLRTINPVKIDIHELMCKSKKSTSNFDFNEFYKRVDKYLVYQKKFFSFGIIPPKIKISIGQ